MAQLFPKWTNKLPLILAVSSLVLVSGIVGFFWYYGSPWYTDVGYRPKQPVPYSHKLHAGDLGIDCRYCHNFVEVSAEANIPPTQTCMNCHTLILPESKKLLPIRESWATGKPMQWIRIHKLPDYAYFDHSAHLRAGVGCSDCHGRIDQMEVVEQVKPLSMGWCLDCHRNPDMHLRPLSEITNMKWIPPKDQLEFAARVKRERHISPPENCSACHR
ncbi:MAG: cytochrome C [Calditrichaeota bacterium]|nr:MAG: cytochrome C [Calditrichota bacterium]